jgi:hypothetical protein
MYPPNRLRVADDQGRLICYSKARLMRLREGIGDVDDDGSLDLDLDTGDDDEHTGHLADAARAIFANTSLSNEAKLRKLKLLLKIGDDDEGEPDEAVAEGLTRRVFLRAIERGGRPYAAASPRSNFNAAFPGLGVLTGAAALMEAWGGTVHGGIPSRRGPRRRPAGGLTVRRFLEALRASP